MSPPVCSKCFACSALDVAVENLPLATLTLSSVAPVLWKMFAHSGYFAKTPHFGHLQSLIWRSTFEPTNFMIWSTWNSCFVRIAGHAHSEWADDLEVASGWSSCHIGNFKPNTPHFMDITWLFTTAFQASPARTSTKRLSGSHCPKSECRHLLAGHDLKQHLAELNWAATNSRQSNLHWMSFLPILPILHFQKHFIRQHSCQCALIAPHLHTCTWLNKKSSHIGWSSLWHWQRLHCEEHRGHLVDKAGAARPLNDLKLFDISMGSAPPKSLADELLTERDPPEVMKLALA